VTLERAASDTSTRPGKNLETEAMRQIIGRERKRRTYEESFSGT